jgi:hypothetical protein
LFWGFKAALLLLSLELALKPQTKALHCPSPEPNELGDENLFLAAAFASLMFSTLSHLGAKPMMLGPTDGLGSACKLDGCLGVVRNRKCHATCALSNSSKLFRRVAGFLCVGEVFKSILRSTCRDFGDEYSRGEPGN